MPINILSKLINILFQASIIYLSIIEEMLFLMSVHLSSFSSSSSEWQARPLLPPTMRSHTAAFCVWDSLWTYLASQPLIWRCRYAPPSSWPPRLALQTWSLAAGFDGYWVDSWWCFGTALCYDSSFFRESAWARVQGAGFYRMDGSCTWVPLRSLPPFWTWSLSACSPHAGCFWIGCWPNVLHGRTR